MNGEKITEENIYKCKDVAYINNIMKQKVKNLENYN